MKEEKEKKGGGALIKIIIAILEKKPNKRIILIVIALIVVLLWPVIGNKLLKSADKQPVKEKTPVTNVAKPDTVKKSAAQPVTKEEAKFTLTKEDQAKDLANFSEADTVNYKIVGTKATHTMQKGEMLTTIALKYYGDKKLWPYIAKYNGLTSKTANKLTVGSKIKVPELANK